MEEKQPPTKVAKLPESEEQEKVIKLLEERLGTHDDNRRAAQGKLHDICEGLKDQIDELEDRIIKELEEKFIPEDKRLQATLDELRENSSSSVLQKIRADLLVEQSYDIIENKDSNLDLTTLYKLKAERRIVPKLMEMRKLENFRVTSVNRKRVFVEFTRFNNDEEKVLSDHTIVNPVKYRCLLFKEGNEQESKEYSLDKNEDDNSFSFAPNTFNTETTYGIKAKMVFGDNESEWSEIVELTPEFKGCCVWKKCPDNIDISRKYSVDGRNPRTATNVCAGSCTIIGDTPIPLNAVTSWEIKILKSENNDGSDIYVGVAPSDINRNIVNCNNCGWYLKCYSSRLCSGPPHDYSGKDYGPRKKENGQYVHTGDSVGVVVDTTKGDLSFVLDGVNHGVAYEGIPLDKPLVPCVLLYWKGDSVELDISEMKETEANSSIPVPSNITTKGTAWDSIILTWGEVSGASFYQVEVDGSKSWESSSTNVFTKRGLHPETEHSFRVRAARGSSVSKWSSVVKGRTLKEPEFSGCGWKECPDGIDEKRKYIVDEKNPRTAINANDGYCTIIGSTYIPLNKVTSWSIKILKSKLNDGGSIFIGIAPSDIDQNDNNYGKFGWYFNCYLSALKSGPPHKYNNENYGPRKGVGKYVRDGDSVGFVMDTTNGDLSFVLNGVNLGVAYDGIPLDKLLVPCILLYYQGDSVELVT